MVRPEDFHLLPFGRPLNPETVEYTASIDPRTARLAVFSPLGPMTPEEKADAARYFEELRRINDEWARRSFKDLVQRLRDARHLPSD